MTPLKQIALLLCACLFFNVQLISQEDCTRDSLGIIPIMDFGAGQFYGIDGGLYLNGSNVMPSSHEQAGIQLAHAIQPLDTFGNPDPNGKIGMMSVGMSNTIIFFRALEEAANAYPDLNPKVAFANCAQGGQDIDAILNTRNRYWYRSDTILRNAGLHVNQVQVIWFMQATHISNFDINEGISHIDSVERKFIQAFEFIEGRYPNLKQLYCPGRDYGGYSQSGGNPEPYGSYTNWAFKKILQGQINGDPLLAFDGPNATMPWLAWGGNLWADGKNLRSDGMNWICPDDYRGDGVHPGLLGRTKWRNVVIAPFINEPTTYWFRKQNTHVKGAVGNETKPHVYPNPAGSELNIDFLNENYSVRVIDVLGRNLFEREGFYGRTKINVSEFRAGLVFVVVEKAEGNERQVVKVMID